MKLPAELRHDTLLMPRQASAFSSNSRSCFFTSKHSRSMTHLVLSAYCSTNSSTWACMQAPCPQHDCVHGRSLPQVARNDFQHEHRRRRAPLLPRTGNGPRQPLAPQLPAREHLPVLSSTARRSALQRVELTPAPPEHVPGETHWIPQRRSTRDALLAQCHCKHFIVLAGMLFHLETAPSLNCTLK